MLPAVASYPLQLANAHVGQVCYLPLLEDKILPRAAQVAAKKADLQL